MATATGQVLIDQIVPLAVPALKVASITAQVINLTCTTVTGAVEVTGVLLETITQVAIATNQVIQQVAALPFTGFITVPGAIAGEPCAVTQVAVEGITVQFVSDVAIREVAVIRITVATGPGAVPFPQPTSPPFEARPPGVFVARATGTSFTCT